jgi:ubiquinone biosynthesis protein COQ9/tetratricopeptide (TPR) repeat protein
MLALHPKEMDMKARGRDIKGVSDVKGVRDIKGMRSANTRPDGKQEQLKGKTEQVKQNLSGVQDTVQDNVQAGLSQAQSKMQSGASEAQEALEERTQVAKERLNKAQEKARELPHTVEKMLLKRALKAGVSGVKRGVSKRLRKAKDNVGHLPHAVQDVLQTGVGAAQNVVGKGTQGVSKRLKKTRESKKGDETDMEALASADQAKDSHPPHAVQDTLQTDAGEAQDVVGKGTQGVSERLKKAKDNVGHLPHAVQDTLQTGVGAAQNVVGKGTQGVSKRLKKGKDNVDHPPHAVQDTLQTDAGEAQDVVGKGTQGVSERLKKARDNVGHLPHAVQDVLQTGAGAAQNVVGKGTQGISKRLKKTRESKKGDDTDMEALASADQYLERAQHLLTEKGDHRQASIALFEAGKLLHEQLKKKEESSKMQEQYQFVRRFHERSLAIDEELKDNEGVTANLEALVDVTLAQGDYSAADQYLDREVQVLTEQGNKKQASEALYNAGSRVYERLKQQNTAAEMQDQYQLVRRFYEQSLSIDGEQQDKQVITPTLEALVDVTISQGDYSAAEQYLDRVVQVLTEQGNKKQASEALYNAGSRIYKQLEEQDSAGEHKDEDQNRNEAKGESEANQ